MKNISHPHPLTWSGRWNAGERKKKKKKENQHVETIKLTVFKNVEHEEKGKKRTEENPVCKRQEKKKRKDDRE